MGKDRAMREQMKLHKDFREKHGLDDGWKINILDSRYSSVDEEKIRAHVESGMEVSEALEWGIHEIVVQNGIIITIHKGNEVRAYLVLLGENYMEESK